jgi:hypothetical protein
MVTTDTIFMADIAKWEITGEKGPGFKIEVEATFDDRHLRLCWPPGGSISVYTRAETIIGRMVMAGEIHRDNWKEVR